jgi:hypothetical protein
MALLLLLLDFLAVGFLDFVLGKVLSIHDLTTNIYSASSHRMYTSMILPHLLEIDFCIVTVRSRFCIIPA